MQEKEKTYLNSLNENKKKRRWAHIFAGLCGIFVATGVFGALILPGLGLDDANLICTIEEHTHDESCGGAEVCTLEEHTHEDSCYVSAVADQGEDVNEGLVVSMTTKQSEGLTGEQLSVTVTSAFSKANSTYDKVKVVLSAGVLPEGLKLAGFNESGQKTVIMKGNNGEILHTIILTIVEDENTGITYIEFEQPEGSTLEFNVQFNSENGVMPAETSAIMTLAEDKIEGLEEGTNVTVPEGLTLTWKADHAWDPVDKTVSTATLKVNSDDAFTGNVVYTITANSSNNEESGEIWTDHLIVEDTLTLPTNISLPEGAKINDAKTQIVTADGQTILSFTQLQGGTVEELAIGEDKKTISYKLNIPNSHKENNIPTGEQDNLALEMTLDAPLLVLPDGYTDKDAAEIAADIISNHVKLTSVPYKEYTVEPTEDEVTTTPVLLEEEYHFYKSANGSNFGAGDAIMYTFEIGNDGETVISVKDANGTPRIVTDPLPSYVYMTEAQVEELVKKGGTYNKETNTVSWTLANDIGVGEKVRLDFWVTVKDAKTVDSLGLKKDGKIENVAEWRGGKSNPQRVNYITAELDVEKTAADASGDELVQNGEQITYTLTISNPTRFESIIDEIVTDTLPAGVHFESMTVNGVTLTDSGSYTFHDSTTGGAVCNTEKTNGCKVDHSGTFTIDGQNLSWTIGCLQAWEQVVITYTCTVDTDELEDRTVIENTAEMTDDSDTNIIGVDYPVKLDKQVISATKDGQTLDVDLSKAYDSGTVFGYTVTVTNDPDTPSNKDNLVLEDLLPEGMLPYGHSLIQTDSTGNKTDLGTDWAGLLDGTYDTENYSYSTIIDGKTVQVDVVDGTVKLSWTIGKLEAGASFIVSYQAQMILTQAQIDEGISYKFTNTATVDEVTKDVTVTGGKMVGNLQITKNFHLYYNVTNFSGKPWLGKLGGESDERWDIEFVLTGVDSEGNPIVLDEETGSTEKIISMRDFEAKTSGACVCTIKKLPVGIYTLTERNYEDDYYQLVRPYFGVAHPDGTNTYNYYYADDIDILENKTTGVYDYNQYYEKDRVNLQKSVYEIATENADGSWTSLPDKYLFPTDTDSNTKTLVVYDITVSSAGGYNVQLTSLKDQLPEGMKFLGIYSKSDYAKSRNSFRTTSLTLSNINTLLDQTILDKEYVEFQKNPITVTPTYNEESNVVNFQLTSNKGGQAYEDGTFLLPLNGGEAFSFLMLCEVDDSVVAGQELTNTVELKVYNVDGLSNSPEYEVINTPCDSNQNNGDAVLVDTEESGTMTIQSSVTVVPENTIVPGIEKNAVTYIKVDTTKELALGDTTNIPSNSVVKWEVTLHNNGTKAMTNYKVQDSVTPDFHLMTKSEATKYKIAVPFSFQLYDFNGNAVGEPVNISETVWNTVTDNSTSNYEFLFEGDTYTIPSGYYAVLTVYTNNESESPDIYKNTATLIPIDQSFIANKVRYGELVKDSTGKYIGVSAYDYVYALGQYASISWKTITEKADSKNTAKGTSTKNYISVDRDSEYVVYTNNIQNISENNFNRFVIIDLMPMVNDTGVINRNDLRGSEFSVLFNGNMKVQVLDAEGKVVAEPEYTVEFSNKTGFTTKDFAGESSVSWHSQWNQDDRSFRIILADDFYLNPQYTLKISYEGKIDSAATPGTIAWNSFGYQYYSGGLPTPMRAEPPKVGVMIPTVPIIQKEVVDSYDKIQERDGSIEFTFALWDAQTYETERDNAKLCEFTVCQGGYRELTDLTDTNGNEIKLENGKSYVITELTDNMPESYEMVGIGEKGGTLADSYTFTYYNNKDIRILARNLIDNYQMELPDTGGIGTEGFTIGGILLMSLAAFIYGTKIIITKKKERTR